MTLPRRRTFLAGCLGLALAPAWASSSSAAAPAKGALVIAGGALRADTAEVWTRIIALAGGQGARIAVFPSAAGNPQRAGQTTAAILRRYGADPFVVPVAVRLAGTDVRRSADDAALAEQVRTAGGVFFVGGDQARITQALLRPDGSRSAVLDAVWDVYRGGGVVAGTSAGAAVMSSTMFNDAPDLLAVLRDGLPEGRALAPGLGFIGDKVFIDQHFLVRGRFARMLPAMRQRGYQLGLGIDENTALVVSGDVVEVLGYKGALLVDLSQATGGQLPGPFRIQNAVLSYLDRGDRYNLATGAYVPGADRSVTLDMDDDLPGPPYSNDILANNAIVELMERLVRNPATEALGIASGDPRQRATSRERLGFAFTLKKTPHTRAYESAGSGGLSIVGVRLDVEPVQVGSLQPQTTGKT
ncbi:cyanophycinase [Pseudoduganella ginsengisoli]|nr:cyanophycinase [Pseudoduganella ginsengisoli]